MFSAGFVLGYELPWRVIESMDTVSFSGYVPG